MAGTFLCPGYAKIWCALPNVGAHPNSGTPGTWRALPHTITWALEPNVEDPTEIRTSDTGGLKIAVGSGATSYKLNVTSALTEEDWLYAYILEADGDGDTNGEWATSLIANGADLWLYLAWNSGDTASATFTSSSNGIAISSHIDNGIYLFGTVEPGGYGMDNDSTDPVKAEWSVNVTLGPYLPNPDDYFSNDTDGTEVPYSLGAFQA